MGMSEGQDAPARTRLPTIYPIPFDGGAGPPVACLAVARALAAQGLETPVFALRDRMSGGDVAMVTALPAWTRHLPGQARLRPWAKRRLERAFADSLRPGEIAQLWPGVSPDLVRHLRGRGHPIVVETVNTAMRQARRVLEAAHARAGLPPEHKITEARIAEEEAIYGLADAIFCLSPAVEAALAGTPFRGRILPTSRGTDLRDAPRADPGAPGPNEPLICIFVGRAGIRKGIDRLLEIWPTLPDRLILRIVGRIDPAIAARHGTLLASDRVQAVGYSDDVPRHLARAHIFVLPTLEEGDPKATYEAARAGLPLVVSPVGAGRLGAERPDAVCRIDPDRPETIAATLRDLAADPARRAALGARALAAVQHFGWDAVANRRLDLLQQTFPAAFDGAPDLASARRRARV